MTAPAFQRFSEDELARARNRFDVIAGDVAMKRRGRELVGLCPFHNEKTPSFYVVPEKGFFHCYGCGAHGTAIDYLMRVRGVDFIDAVRELLDLPPQRARQAPPPSPREISDDDREDDQRVSEVLSGCGPLASGTAGYLYLWSRGLVTRERLSGLILESLRFNPAVYCHEVRKQLPAIVAPITSSAGEVTAVQRIWVSDTWDPATAKDSRAPLRIRKKTLGTMGDGAVRLRPATDRLGLAEGVETAIAAMLLHRGLPVWATCGVHRLGFPGHWRKLDTPKGERPELWFPPDRPPRDGDFTWVKERGPSVWIPDDVDTVIVFGDRGETGEIIANHAADWWRREGRQAEARFPLDGFDDLNTQLLGERA